MLKAFSRRSATTVVLAVLASKFALQAQEPAATAEPATTLTLDRVLAEAETVNLSVLSGREFIGQAEQNAVRFRSVFLPGVSARASQSRGDRGNLGVSNSFSAGLSASMTLLDFQQYRSLRAARRAIEVAKLDYQDTVQAVMAAIASLYFEHVRDRAFDAVIESNIERAEALLNLARNQLRAGVATQIDVTRAEAELVTQQQAKLQQESVVLNSALQLKQLLNLDLGSEIVLENFQVRRELDPGVSATALETVLEARADYRAALAARDQLRLETRAAKAARLPVVGVSGSYGVTSEVVLDGDEDTTWTAGIDLSLPIWDGNRIRANERIAASRERQQELALADLRNRIEAEWRSNLQNVVSQIAQIEVAEKNRALAEEELRLARVRYEQGVADNRELIDAENRFTQSSFNLVNALYNYHLARVDLARTRGDVRLILGER